MHAGEEMYYSSSFDYNPIINIAGETIGFAIRADIENSQHPLDTKRNRCTMCLPSIFYSKKGIDAGCELLSKYAKENSFSILMSNYSGNVWNMEAGGMSGFWDKNGKLVAALDSENEGLLIIEKIESGWMQEKHIKK